MLVVAGMTAGKYVLVIVLIILIFALGRLQMWTVRKARRRRDGDRQ